MSMLWRPRAGCTAAPSFANNHRLFLAAFFCLTSLLDGCLSCHESEPGNVTLISCIQGPGSESPLVGKVVKIQGVVTGDFQFDDSDTTRDLGGFTVQEEDSDSDGDPKTSEGIWIYEPETTVDVAIGDLVTVEGTVSEYNGQTQLSNVTSVAVASKSNPLPTLTTIEFPLAAVISVAGGGYAPDLERYEGMYVQFPQDLIVTENYSFERYNDLILVYGDRPTQYTQKNRPDPVGYDLLLQDFGGHKITYDDGNKNQNLLNSQLDGSPDPYLTKDAIRLGDSIKGLIGVLMWESSRFGSTSDTTWRVQDVRDGTNVVTKASIDPRPDLPLPKPPGTFTLASVNVLNYFVTLDDYESGQLTVTGQTPRGPNTPEELARQTEKLVTAILLLEPDVASLIEMENNFLPGSKTGNAIEFLVSELNERAGGDVYGYVYPNSQVVDHTDAISNAFIYNKLTMMIEDGTSPAILDDGKFPSLGLSFDNQVFTGISTNRAGLMSCFTTADGNKSSCLCVEISHFKSKGSQSPGAGNEELNNGAGRNNGIRTQGAEATVKFIASNPTGSSCKNAVIVGDFNAYAKEDPVVLIEEAGYTNLDIKFSGEDAYSYVFDGLKGTLDYGMANEAFEELVTFAKPILINSNEDPSIDYNLDFGRPSTYFDGQTPWRYSDHDPMVIQWMFETVTDPPTKAPTTKKMSKKTKKYKKAYF